MHFVKKAFHDPKFVLISGIAAVFILATLFAGYLAPHDPLFQDYANMLKPPGGEYLLGTDQVGRCLFSRILYGGRTSLLIALLVTLFVAMVGVVIGVFAGYCGGIIDSLIMRLVDMIMAFPHIVFVIALVSVLGTGNQNLILALTLISWTGYARITRSMVISIKSNDYVEQARLGGAGSIEIMLRYMIPNILPYLVVYITQDIGNNLLTLSSLSLLGLGSQPPIPEWGFMLSEGKKYMQTAPWLLVYPGMVILICVIIFNLLGDSLRDVLDPRNEK